MDDKRFDQLTRLFGRGASRRTILKGILGLTGAATGSVVASSADARTIGTRPTFPPPPPPKPTTSTSTTLAPCPGQEQCPNSTLCCPEGSCARSGSQAICCDGTTGHGSVVCGLECCVTELQCCDRECCPSGHVCLTHQFPASDEEICCRAESTCTGSGSFADRAVCCGNDLPQCCVRENGEPVCINPETQCCTDDQCPDDPRFCETGVCLRESQTCDLDFICGDGGSCCPAQGDEETGACVDDDQCCVSVECRELTDFANCQIGICNRDVFRCEVVSACEIVDYDCCAVNDSGICALVEERTPCALEDGGTGICCTGECAETSLCSCTRNVECDPERCEECLGSRCRNRCEFTPPFLLELCAGNNECAECLSDHDCFQGDYCDTETNLCFDCKSDADCFSECLTCDVATGSCIPNPEANGEPCRGPDEPGFTCCFGNCLEVCETCTSNADCPGCERCELSGGPGQAHCQPCFIHFQGCCFDDFCITFDQECCQTDADCPQPECGDDRASIVRYQCVPVTENGGTCEAVVDQTCDGCSSCQETDTGPQCVDGCRTGSACCIGDHCQPLRTCPFACAEDADCPGECAFCQENGFCGELEECGPTTTTPAPVTCVDNADCTVEFQVCCDGVCEDPGVCLCQDCAATGTCDTIAGCCNTTEDCELQNCFQVSCNEAFNLCVGFSDCTAGDNCCSVGSSCNEETGSCVASICEPACESPLVCCDGVCEDPGVCLCQDCAATGTCDTIAGCCNTTEDCELQNCFQVSCNEAFNLCVGFSDCTAGDNCCSVGSSCNEETGSCVASICEPACESPLVCCDGVCEDPGVCLCQDCAATGTCDTIAGCCNTTEDCELQNCFQVSCNETFNLCVGISDCTAGDNCCSVGSSCNEETGSCVASICEPACESPLVCCDGVCEDPGVCLCQDCAATGTCDTIAGCCNTTEDCELQNCFQVSCNETFNLCVGISDCTAGDNCCSVGSSCNEETGSCVASICEPACESPLVCCDGVCEDPGVCLCQDCAANGTCDTIAGCCNTTEDCELQNCFQVSCNETFNLCVGISDCTAGDNCCSVGSSCNEQTGSCQQALAASLELSEPGCPVCDAFPNSYCDKSTATCACAPIDSCADGRCGAIDDGCGGLLDCGPCSTTPAPVPQAPVSTEAPAPVTCHSEGERCVSDNQCCVGCCRGRNCGDRGRRTCQAACFA